LILSCRSERALEVGQRELEQGKMGRKRALRAIAGWACLVGAAAVGACAQTAGSNVAAVPETLRAASATPETAREPAAEVLRQIEDPSTLDIWLLMRDPSRPAGPGRLVLVRQGMNTEKAIPGGPAQSLSAPERPVIHTGDALMVEEHTAVADVRLEAVALEPALKNAQFKARLKIGGQVVRVVAISSGRASFAPESEIAP
jgi:hypothetical protein